MSADWAPDLDRPPRHESPIHPDAVGSHGRLFLDWAAEHWPETPLPWQARVAARALEHDADGRLLHRRVGVSVPRQVGKSVLLRMLAAWRINSEQLFGEPQTVLHVAHALTTTEEVFHPALQWAKDRGYVVREANGQMKIQTGDNRWIPRSTQTGYGFTLSLALVDEAWAVAPRRVDSGYGPTLSARRSGQVWMFSTANQEATPLFPRFRETAMERPGWLLLEWSAPQDCDPSDPAVWEASSPVPLDATRRALMGDEFASNPSTFAFERLNRWPAGAGLGWGQRVAALLPAPTHPRWSGPLVGALESDPGGGSWGVAVSDGQRVEAAQTPRLPAALAWLRARGPAHVLAHGTVARQLVGADDLDVRQIAANDQRAAAAVLRDHAPDLAWSGVLHEQLQNARATAPGGVEQIDAMRSTGPVSAVKAAAWALWSARTAPPATPAIWVASASQAPMAAGRGL